MGRLILGLPYRSAVLNRGRCGVLIKTESYQGSWDQPPNQDGLLSFKGVHSFLFCAVMK